MNRPTRLSADFDLFDHYPGNLEWLSERTILYGYGGSHAYGMATEASDIDIRGIAVPPPEYFFGFANTFNQTEWKYGDDPCRTDVCIYSLHKFAKLCADANPNILELLWLDPEDVIYATAQYDLLRQIRDLFLSKKARYTFSGYAVSQLKRIQRHRKWLLDPPKAPPTRADYGLPEHTLLPKEHLAAATAAVQKKLDEWELDLDGIDAAKRQQIVSTLTEQHLSHDERYRAAARMVGLDDNLVEVMGRERKYREAARHFQQYRDWQKNRNPARAALEAKHGYDTKHAAHLVRLLRMGAEILDGKGVLVRRPDAEELLQIRAGAWSYDQLIEYAAKADDALHAAYVRSDLPHAPDINRLDRLIIRLTESTFRVDHACAHKGPSNAVH